MSIVEIPTPSSDPVIARAEQLRERLRGIVSRPSPLTRALVRTLRGDLQNAIGQFDEIEALRAKLAEVESDFTQRNAEMSALMDAIEVQIRDRSVAA